MNEGEILEMGAKLIERDKQLDLKEKIMNAKFNSIMKSICQLYAFSRELDELIGGSSPAVVKHLIERCRGLCSEILFSDDDDEIIIDVSFNP